MPIKIEETNDYLTFEKNVIEAIDTGRGRLYENNYPFIEITHGYNLFGDAGMGKSSYIDKFEERCNQLYDIKIEAHINSIDDICSKNKIYIGDGTNESMDYDEDKLFEKIKEKNCFIITASGVGAKQGHRHEINPSEETLDDIGFIINKHFNEYNFSTREKHLMTKVTNYDKILKKERHSLFGKAFENVIKHDKSLTNHQKKEYLASYKAIATLHPFNVIDKSANPTHIEGFCSKKIIQKKPNLTSGRYVFSHLNISMTIFLRKFMDQRSDLATVEEVPEKIVEKLGLYFQKISPMGAFIAWYMSSPENKGKEKIRELMEGITKKN